jgi:cytochrome P450
MRLYPPIAAISRVAIEPDEIGGEAIPAGTMVIVAPYVVHRHRRLWDRPEIFDPERFMANGGRPVHRYAYLPFGAGPRICLGAAFALQEACLMLAAIVKNFDLRLAPGFEVQPLLRITLRPKGGLPMILRRRG